MNTFYLEGRVRGRARQLRVHKYEESNAHTTEHIGMYGFFERTLHHSIQCVHVSRIERAVNGEHYELLWV